MEKIIVLILLIILAYQDVKKKKISMILVVSIAVVNIIAIIISGEFEDRIIWILLCVSVFGVLGFLFKKYMGIGDTILLASLAINMNLNEITSVIILASIATSLTGFMLLIFKKMNVKDELPYVPFLTASVFFLFLRSWL